jgi:hypothetical protein
MTINNPNYTDPNTEKYRQLIEQYQIRYDEMWADYADAINSNLSTAILDNKMKRIDEYTKLIEQTTMNYYKNLKYYDVNVPTSRDMLKYFNKKSKPINPDYIDRQIDINKYYTMKYQSEIYILKLIIFFCGLALIGCLFFFKGFIGETIYILYLGIIISIGIIIICYNIYKLIYKDNQKYEENDYGYMNKPGTDLSNIPTITKIPNEVESDENKCV